MKNVPLIIYYTSLSFKFTRWKSKLIQIKILYPPKAKFEQRDSKNYINISLCDFMASKPRLRCSTPLVCLQLYLLESLSARDAVSAIKHFSSVNSENHVSSLKNCSSESEMYIIIGLISERPMRAALFRTSWIISESRARSKRCRAPSERTALIQEIGEAPAFEFTLNPGALLARACVCASV